MPRHLFYARLERAQDDLLSAVVKGPVALATFQTQWSKLVTDFEEEIRLDQLDDEVMEMAKSTASVVSIFTGSFLHLETKGTDIYNKLSKGLENMLDNNGSSAISPTPASTAPFQSHRDLYVWLRQHLHNPYPSATAKASLVASSGLSSDSVAARFQNARERIGWTTLARHRFQGRRSAIVDAARRAFVEPDPHRPLPPSLHHAFSIVKQNLANLLSDASSHKDVDQIRVEGLSPEINNGAEVHDELTGELQRGARKDCRAELQGDPQTTCNSPNSRTLHLLDLDQSGEEEADMTPPPPIAGCKRRADTDLEAYDSSCSPRNMRYRSRKRQRSEPPSTSNGVHSSLVLTLIGTGVQASNVESALPSLIRSTPSSTGMPSNVSFTTASPALPSFPTTQSPSQPLASAPGSRKRRLSDAGCDIIPKRPRHIRSGHRMQIASNPLPLGPNEIAQDSALFENWYQNVTYAASEPFGGDLSSDCSPATSILNTPWTDGLPVLPNDFIVPSQQVDLSDEDFKAMLASGYNMSSIFMPIDQGIFGTLPSLDDLFPPSFSGVETLIQRPAQYMIDLGFKAVSTSQIEECQTQLSSIPTFLSSDHPHRILSAPLKEIGSSISDTLTQCTSLCGIGEDTLDNWTAGVLGWKDTNLSAQM
uniref:B1 homeodomain mating type protein n=1 Tax=Heterobasidion irregulare TaxID=984962 RepID=S5REN5_9AGAM|nr:b1 homeodomain mating type protein [Heterobasidion irregulare]